MESTGWLVLKRSHKLFSSQRIRLLEVWWSRIVDNPRSVTSMVSQLINSVLYLKKSTRASDNAPMCLQLLPVGPSPAGCPHSALILSEPFAHSKLDLSAFWEAVWFKIQDVVRCSWLIFWTLSHLNKFSADLLYLQSYPAGIFKAKVWPLLNSGREFLRLPLLRVW